MFNLISGKIYRLKDGDSRMRDARVARVAQHLESKARADGIQRVGERYGRDSSAGAGKELVRVARQT